jgi:periplasmic protein TonB
MSTPDSAAVWSATSLALDETKIGAAGLSIRQRKLLALLSQPASLPQLAQRIALPVDDVQVALERFAKLGLAQSSEAVPVTAMPTQLRSASVEDAPSQMPMKIGVAVAALALIGAGAWLLRGSGASTAAAPTATATTKAQAPTATGPNDTADNGLPGAVIKPAATAPAVTPAAAANAASAAAAAQARAALAPPTVAAVAAVAAAPVPPKAVAPAAAAPTAVSATATPTVPPPVTPTLTLATALPTAPVGPPAAAPVAITPAPSVSAAITAAPATQVAAIPAASPPAEAAARPAPAANREIKLVNRVEPTFPRGFDADKGTVRARLQVDARGAVTGVDIVEANPPRVFDRTVRAALQQWRYEPTGEAFSVIAEINFTR